MNAITQQLDQEDNSTVEKIERFHSLSSGQYWRAVTDVVGHPIAEGTVLLIESIKWVDNLPHTIVLRTHPDIYDRFVHYTDVNGRENGRSFSAHRFLVADFVRDFEFEPDYQRIRTAEMAAVNAEVAKHQQFLLDAQSNPDILNQVVADELAKEVMGSESNKNLPIASASLEYSPEVVSMVSGSLAHAIGTGITESRIEEMKGAASRELKIVTIKANWMKKQTELIAKTIQKLTPYFQEQAAASLAQTEDVMSHVKKLLTGIETLDLYIGKDVSIVNYKKGESAPPDVKLTICQKKLFMDEELAVWADVDNWFDFTNIHQFFETLSNEQGLLDQVFPTPRCILVMAANNRYIDYGDRYTNQIRNSINKNVLLAVRDGGNIYTVQSPVESHMGAGRLFPSKSDQDRIFTGVDGSAIKFTDLDYTSALSSHEAYALHYKRFLILLCGLDHRENLFGDFYTGPKNMDFVSASFQESNFIFLHDDDGEGLLGHVNKPSLESFIKSKNSILQSGSRVICYWRDLMNSRTAPGAVKRIEEYHSGRTSKDEHRYRPNNKFDSLIARKKGNSLVVDILVRPAMWSANQDRTFNCLVNLSEYRGDGAAYLCLDDVDPEELQWYINNRRVRSGFLEYMQLFKAAVKQLRGERARELESREYLANTLMEGNIVTSKSDAMGIVNRAVIAWRATNRGEPLPSCLELQEAGKPWKELLELMYQLGGNAERQLEPILSYCASHGISTVRVVVGKRSKFQVYAAPSPEEADHRAVPFSWVHKITLKTGRNGIAEASRKWVVLPKKADVAETVLFEDGDLVAKWADLPQAFKSPVHKQNLLAVPEMFIDRVKNLFDRSPTSTEKITNHFFTVRSLISPIGALRVPTIILPFAAFTTAENEVSYLCAVCNNTPSFVKSLLSGDALMEFIESFGGRYRNQDTPKNLLNRSPDWELMCLNSSTFDFESDILFDTTDIYTGELKDSKPKATYSLDLWLKNTIAKSKRLTEAMYCPVGIGNLDKMFGITQPENFKPVAAVSYSLTLYDANGLGKVKTFKWLDIYPYEEGQDETRSRKYDKAEKNNIGSHRYGYSVAYFPSEAAAITSIEEAYVPYVTNELDDYVNPPAEYGQRFVLR